MTYSTDEEDYLGGGGNLKYTAMIRESWWLFLQNLQWPVVPFMIMTTAHPHLNKITTCNRCLIYIPSQNFCQIWWNLKIPKTISNIHETLTHVLIIHRLYCMSECRVIACSRCNFKNSYFSLEFELEVSRIIHLHPLTVTVLKSLCNITNAVHVVTACNVTIKEGRWNWSIS
jgi:hypothetical protein